MVEWPPPPGGGLLPNNMNTMPTLKAGQKPVLRFALAGQIVSDWRVARRIQLAAMRDGREWLVPQARNVAIKLRRAAATANLGDVS